MQAPSDFDLGLWVAGLGPRLDATEVREYGGLTWLLVFDEQFALAIEHDVNRAMLVLTAGLGEPAPGAQAQAYKLLLEVSTLWRETGGVRMGVDPDDGSVVQLCDFPLAGLNLDALEACVRNFIDLAKTARVGLAGLSVDTPAPSLRPFEFMRV